MNTLYLALLGVIILIVSSFSPVHQVSGRIRENIVLTFDKLTAIRIFPQLIHTQDIFALEQKNRQLSVQLLKCQQDISYASASAQPVVLHDQRHVPSFLSYAGGQWIILSGAIDRLRVGDVVVMDDIFLGTLSRVTSTYSVVETIHTTTLPLLVQHEKSKAVAVLRRGNEQSIAQFSKKIEDVQNADIFVTIPDGVHTKRAYPVATLKEVTSENSDSMTQVSVEPMAIPRIGSRVEIVLSQE